VKDQDALLVKILRNSRISCHEVQHALHVKSAILPYGGGPAMPFSEISILQTSSGTRIESWISAPRRVAAEAECVTAAATCIEHRRQHVQYLLDQALRHAHCHRRLPLH
jgi:hypothetical protein